MKWGSRQIQIHESHDSPCDSHEMHGFEWSKKGAKEIWEGESIAQSGRDASSLEFTIMPVQHHTQFTWFNLLQTSPHSHNRKKVLLGKISFYYLPRPSLSSLLLQFSPISLVQSFISCVSHWMSKGRGNAKEKERNSGRLSFEKGRQWEIYVDPQLICIGALLHPWIHAWAKACLETASNEKKKCWWTEPEPEKLPPFKGKDSLQLDAINAIIRSL